MKVRSENTEEMMEALKEAKERYDVLFSLQLEAVYICDFEGNFIDANPAALDMLGYTRDEITSLDFESLLTPEQFPKVFETVKEIIETGSQKELIEYRLKHKDGHYIDVETKGFLIYKDGKPYAIQGTARDISERKRVKAEADLHSSLLNQSSEFIISVDLNGKINYANLAILNALGFGPSDIIGRSVDIFPDDQAEISNLEVLKLTLNEGHWEGERILKIKGGSEIILDFRTQLIKDPKGEPSGIFAIGRDITDKKKAEEALQESENMLKEAQRVGHMGSWSWSVKEDKVIWSDELYNIVGLDPNKSPPTYAKHPSLYTKESWPKLNEAVERAVSEGRSYDLELDMVRSDGQVCHTHTKGNAIKDESGNVIGLFGTVQDITERIKSEEALRESEDRHKTVSDLITDWVWSLSLEADGTTSWEWVSDSMKRVTGYSSDDIPMIEGWFSLIHPDDVVAVEKNFANTLSTRQDGSVEYRIKRSDGEYIWIHVFSHAIWDEHEKRVVRLVGATKDITEKKKAEEALRESEARSKIAQENAKIGIWDWRLSDGHLVWSDVTYRLFGLEPVEQTPSYELFESFVDPEDWKVVDAKVRSSVENNTPYFAEMRITRKDGEERILFAEGSVLRDPEGTKTRLLGTIIDVTERKRAENALRESQERLLKAQHIAHLGFWEWDLKTSELYWSDEAYHIYGLDSDKFQPTYDDFLDILHPDDKQTVVEAVDSAMQDKTEFRVDHRIILPSGLTRYVNSQGELIRDEKGTPVKMMGTMIDITDRMKAEEAVRLSEEKYRTLFSTSPEAIMLIDLKGTILDCNDATEKISGLSKDQLIGVDILDLDIFDKDTIAKMAEMFKELLDYSDFKPIELELNIAGIKKWIEAYPEIMKKNDEPYALLLIIRDITERKKSEREISQRNEELSTLNTISGTINQTLELNEVLGVALEETISMLNVEGGLIYLAEKSKEKFTPAIHYGFSEDAIKSVSEFSMGEGISGQAAQLGVPLFVPNLAEDSQHISSAFFKDGWESLVSVPLKSKGDVVGVMTVSSKRTERFGPEDIGLLRAIGNQIGVAIENARLYGLTQEELSERRRAERKVSEQNKFLKNVLESLTHPFYVVNVNNHLIEIANSAAREKGLSVGSSCHDLSHGSVDPCGTEGFTCPIDEIIRTKQPVSTEHYHYDSQGDMRYIEIHAYPIFNDEGEITRVIESTVDITDRKHAESEREILFRELKHRVKNNLQLLSSMVDMQILRSEDPALKLKLQEIQSVVDTIALIYTRAYEGSRLLGLNLNNFIEELLIAILKFKANEDLVILHSISGDDVKLNTDCAIPMALVANELIFNAVKHAFNGRLHGNISITLKENEKEITMTVADDGVGIRSDMDLSKPDSFGLKIVKNLVGQLNGTIDCKMDNGTIFTIKIPVQKEEG